MVHRFYKHKLLLDENMSPRSEFPRVNGMFDIKHVRDDFNKSGLLDPEVYSLAVELRRLVVTFNIKDFRQLAEKSLESGVVGISANLSSHQIDTKLAALLVRSSEKALYGKFTLITGES